MSTAARIINLCTTKPRTLREITEITGLTPKAIKSSVWVLRKRNKLFLAGMDKTAKLWGVKPKSSTPMLTVWRGPLPTEWSKA